MLSALFLYGFFFFYNFNYLPKNDTRQTFIFNSPITKPKPASLSLNMEDPFKEPPDNNNYISVVEGRIQL